MKGNPTDKSFSFYSEDLAKRYRQYRSGKFSTLANGMRDLVRGFIHTPTSILNYFDPMVPKTQTVFSTVTQSFNLLERYASEKNTNAMLPIDELVQHYGRYNPKTRRAVLDVVAIPAAQALLKQHVQKNSRAFMLKPDILTTKDLSTQQRQLQLLKEQLYHTMEPHAELSQQVASTTVAWIASATLDILANTAHQSWTVVSPNYNKVLELTQQVKELSGLLKQSLQKQLSSSPIHEQLVLEDQYRWVNELHQGVQGWSRYYEPSTQRHTGLGLLHSH
jgi:hypothetical protein